MNINQSSCRYETRFLTPAEVDHRLVAAWADLEKRAIYPNAFLSPYFVLPALKYLVPAEACFGIFIEKLSAGSRDLVGVAWFQTRRPNRRFPLPHLAAFLSIHSYLSDFLIDQSCAAEVQAHLYQTLRHTKQIWHGLYINNASQEILWNEQAQDAAREQHIRWHGVEEWERAILFPQEAETTLTSYIPKRRQKNYQKNLKRLEEHGVIEWAVQMNAPNAFQSSLEDFLRVEHSGWKKENGTSLLSNPHEANFFREMMNGFHRAGRAYLTEIRLNRQVIASTANIISAEVGFALKIGWDNAYAEYGLGIINEIKFIQHLAQCPSLTYIDGCTAPDSYINEFWPGRRKLCEGWFSLTLLGEAALQAVQNAKKLKSALRSRLKSSQ
ncbi:MAG: hypothetical protein DDG60_16580 [Anaerolineae bacterium]|nr:MAG: hypothetical protein DDG60_16580 [Anaerolineae bacterium]